MKESGDKEHVSKKRKRNPSLPMMVPFEGRRFYLVRGEKQGRLDW